MSDRIFINDIEIFAKHGVFPEEKLQTQRFLVSVVAKFEAAHAKIFDEVAYTVDYSKLLNIIVDVVQKSSFHLIERLAAHLSDKIFRHFKLITAVDIEIKKFPEHLAYKNFASIGFASSFFRNDK